MSAKRYRNAVVLLALGLVTAPAAADVREAKQAELDAACEAARQQRLEPMRKKFVEECVRQQEQESREECEAYYADYGAATGTRAPLFYDLPPCVEAFEYANSDRAGD